MSERVSEGRGGSEQAQQVSKEKSWLRGIRFDASSSRRVSALEPLAGEVGDEKDL